jgi:hypothetical protein
MLFGPKQRVNSGRIYIFSFTPFLVSSLQLPYGLRRGECGQPHCPLIPEASHTSVGGNTVHLANGLPQESLEHDGTRTSLPAKPYTNLDDAGPIVHRPMGLPGPAGCDRAWTWTRISSGTASTAMQSLRPLLPSMADYLTTVAIPKLNTSLTMHRLSEHSLAIERGRGWQTWLSREDRLCSQCPQNEVETELYS